MGFYFGLACASLLTLANALSIRQPNIRLKPTAEFDNCGFNLSATCDDQMELFVDKNLLAASNNWRQTSVVYIPPHTKEIEIRCTDGWILGGILAASDNGLITNNAWTCSSDDGTTWNSAHELGANGVTAVDISPDAKWIWTDRPTWTHTVKKRHTTAICKIKLPTFSICGPPTLTSTVSPTPTTTEPTTMPTTTKPTLTPTTTEPTPTPTTTEPTSGFSLRATCNDKMELFADGNLLASSYNWRETSQVNIPANTKNVEIHCMDSCWVVEGILASSDNGLITDNSWRCSSDNGVTWGSAYEIVSNRLSVPDISPNAKWISTGLSAWTKGGKVICKVNLARQNTVPSGSTTTHTSTGCEMENINLSGNDIPGGLSTEKKWQSCQTKCKTNPKCTHWTFRNSDGNCWLKNGNYAQSKEDGLVSGPKDCSGCEMDNINFSGNDIPGGLSTQKNWQSCQTKCKTSPQCTHWTFRNSDANCWFKTGNDVQFEEDGMVSGPQGCSASKWSTWGTWALCSASCGAGTKTRKRTCSNSGGKSCPGSNEETIKCNIPSCGKPNGCYMKGECNNKKQDWSVERRDTWGCANLNSCTDKDACEGRPKKLFKYCENNQDQPFMSRFLKDGQDITFVYPEDTTSTTATITMSTTTPTTTGCEMENINFSGNDIPGGLSAEKNWQICQTKCKTNPKCTHWTFRNSDGNCWLKNGNYAQSKEGGLVSEPKDCSDTTSTTATTTMSTTTPTTTDSIYFIAGGQDTWRDIELYHPTMDNLPCSMSPPPLNNDWYLHTTFYYNNTIHLYGGYNTASTCISYSNNTEEWKTHTISTHRRWGHSSVVLKKKVFIMGGKETSGNYVGAESTPLPLTDQPILTPVPNLDYKGQYQCTTKVDEDTLVVTGGYANNGHSYSYFSFVIEYNTKTRTKTSLPSMKQPRSRHGCAVVEVDNTKWIIVAGGYNSDKADRNLKTTEMLQMGKSSWTSLVNLNVARRGHYIAVTQRGVMVIGGYDGNAGKHLSSVELLDWSAKSWRIVQPSLSKSRIHFGGAVEIPASMFDCRGQQERQRNVPGQEQGDLGIVSLPGQQNQEAPKLQSLTAQSGMKLEFQLKGKIGMEKVKLSVDGNEEEFGLTTEWRLFSYPRPSTGSFSVEFLNDIGYTDVFIRGHESQVTDLLPNFPTNKFLGCGTKNEDEKCGYLREGTLMWNGKYTYNLKDGSGVPPK